MPIECRELMSLVPHRIPFLRIDRVEATVRDETVAAGILALANIPA